MGNSDRELARLWALRHSQDPQALEDLCLLIQRELSGYRPAEFAQLRGLDGLPDHSERTRQYVQEFLLDKVLTGESETRCDHVGALKLFYRRYLIDVIKSYLRRSKYLQADPTGPEDGEGTGLVERAVGPDFASDFGGLDALGIGVSKIRAAARQFLADQEPWVRAFLAFSYCPDTDTRETMHALARRLGVRSYAYKAEKLGFNWRGGTPEAFSEQTLVGHWLTGLGITVGPDNQGAILDALKILCHESLLSVSEQEDPRP